MSSSRTKARLFVTGDLLAGNAVALAPAQAHYVNHVMRLGVGDGVAVFNGRDGEWSACIVETGKGRCSVELADRVRRQRREPDLWLLFSPIKKAALDFVVEKATELGVSRLCPVFTQRTVVGRINADRMRANAIEAAEQCERLSVPDVAEPVHLDRLIAHWPEQRPMLVMDETGTGRPIAEVLETSAAGPCGILVGPEGGFARSELDALRKLASVTLVGLGPRILRADTAAVSALACWQALLGDWRDPPPREPTTGNDN